jgi:hypothetical protein
VARRKNSAGSERGVWEAVCVGERGRPDEELMTPGLVKKVKGRIELAMNYKGN